MPDSAGTSIGIVGRLVGSPRSWSGVPTGLAGGLHLLGHQTGYLSAEPSPSTDHRMQRWLRATRRLDDSWAQTPEMMNLRSALVSMRRYRDGELRHTRHWVQMGSEFGHPLPGEFVTLEDMTVAQAVAMPDYPPIRENVAQYWIRRQKAIYRRARACCVASHWTAEGLIAYGVPAHKIHVTGFGCNVRVEVPDRDWSTPRFLFVGVGWKRKNGDAVVNAFLRLRQQMPTAQLDLVGDHPRLDHAGITGHGHLREPGERPQLEELFRTSTCMVVPSTYEPFGMLYPDAGWAGMPSIGTSVGGAPDAIGEGGFAVDPYDPAQLLAAMLAVSQPDRARALGQAARARAQLLTWDAVARRVAAALGLFDHDEEPDLPLGRPASI